MSFEADLRERMRTATEGLPPLTPTLDDVRQRGRRRRAVTSVGAAAAGIVLLAGAVIGIALLPGGGPQPFVDEAPESPSTMPAAPTGETATPGELGRSIVTHSPTGVIVFESGTPRILSNEPTQVVAPLPDGRIVTQTTFGAPIVVAGEGDGDLLVAAREGLLLRDAGTTSEGRKIALLSWETASEELGPEIVLASVDLDTREITEHGVIGNQEDGLVSMRLVDGAFVYTSCHLQCAVYEWRWDEFGEGAPPPPILDADWREGVDVAGDVIATVALRFDPESGGPTAGTLVLHDRATGAVRAEIALPSITTWQVSVSLAADSSMALVSVGDPLVDAVTYVVDDFDGDGRVRRLSSPGAARFTSSSPIRPPATVPSPEDAATSETPSPSPSPQDPVATSDPATSLRDRNFVSERVTEDGQSRELVTGTQIEVRFDQDGDGQDSVGFSAGCNGHSAKVTITDSRLLTAEIAGTAMGCTAEREEQDGWLVAFFDDDPSWYFEDEVLVLVSGTTVIELAEHAE